MNRELVNSLHPWKSVEFLRESMFAHLMMFAESKPYVRSAIPQAKLRCLHRSWARAHSFGVKPFSKGLVGTDSAELINLLSFLNFIFREILDGRLDLEFLNFYVAFH